MPQSADGRNRRSTVVRPYRVLFRVHAIRCSAERAGSVWATTYLEEKLDPRHFARAHRSAIANVRRVKAIHPWFNGHHVVTMDNRQQLRMSRYQHEAFLKLVSSLG